MLNTSVAGRGPALVLCLALAGCARAPSPDDTMGGDPAPIEEMPAADSTTLLSDPATTSVFVFTCPDDFRFSVRHRGDSAQVRLPARTLTLPQLISASGARYGAGDVVYWTKGYGALLETATGTRTGCQGRPAATPWQEAAYLGIEFRALGNEPGWVLEINESEWMRYIGDYGAVQLLTPIPEPVIADDGTRTFTARTDTQTLEAIIREMPCTDTMSGEKFTHTVTVRVDGREMHGCGRMV